MRSQRRYVTNIRILAQTTKRPNKTTTNNRNDVEMENVEDRVVRRITQINKQTKYR